MTVFLTFQDADAIVDTTSASLTQPRVNRYIPSDVQFLGLSIHCSESSKLAKLEGECDVYCGNGSDVMVEMGVEKHDLKELEKELDETMTLISDKIGELDKLGGETQEKNKYMYKTRYSVNECDHPRESTERGVEDNNCVENECTKIENLLESSFQITERIINKTLSMSFVTGDGLSTKTRYKREKTLTSNKVDFALNKRSKTHLELNRMEIQNQTKIRYKHQFLPKQDYLSGDSTVEEPESMNRNDNGGALFRNTQIDSPISCCFQESENTFVPDLQIHPLEFLFKDRQKCPKEQLKRGKRILRFLNCKSKPESPEQTRIRSNTDYTSKALTAFINRRRSIPKEEEGTSQPTYTRAYHRSTAVDKMTSFDNPRGPLRRKAYSKHKLLQTIRFKKGLISVASFRNSLSKIR